MSVVFVYLLFLWFGPPKWPASWKRCVTGIELLLVGACTYAVWDLFAKGLGLFILATFASSVLNFFLYIVAFITIFGGYAPTSTLESFKRWRAVIGSLLLSLLAFALFVYAVVMALLYTGNGLQETLAALVAARQNFLLLILSAALLAYIRAEHWPTLRKVILTASIFWFFAFILFLILRPILKLALAL